MDKQLNDIAPASMTDVAEEKTVDAGPEIAPGAEAAPESDPVTLGGTAVSPGAAFGHAQMFAEGELEIPHFTIEKTQTRAEFTRLRAAVHTVDKEFGELIAELNREEDAPTEAIAFLELHRQLLNDDSIISETQDIIRERLINAEWALSLKLEDIRRSFEEIDDDYLADRIDDIAICRLTGADVVRHALVQKIIAAYEQDDKQKEKRAAAAAKKPAARKTTVRKKV